MMNFRLNETQLKEEERMKVYLSIKDTKIKEISQKTYEYVNDY